jgi:2-polyprenyl-3-methyl-5-hydroxy-6-metoxy-1,4-benzoquinol methylase
MNSESFFCPKCRNQLRFANDVHNFICDSCGLSLPVDGNLPLLFWSTDMEGKSQKEITDKVKSFYETNPFPNYDQIDSVETLREKASKSIFAKLLEDQIPHGSKILEVGCGTGQLSNFLGSRWGRTVVGADMCLNSLKLADGFRQKNNIENVKFVQMNLFKPVMKDESFDLVISNGVLHHTYDPALAFATISKLVKPGGHIAIGLYNKYGRLAMDAKRLIFRLTGDKLLFLDYRMRQKGVDQIRKRTWFRDQYQNPNEYKHTMDEVLGWFGKAGFEYTNSIPKIDFSGEIEESEQIFSSHPVGTKTQHMLSQLRLVFTGAKEGGFFIMIGRKK